MSNNRLEKLHKLLDEAKLDAVVLNPGVSLSYLTGMDFHLSERPTTLIVTAHKNIIVLPRLESLKLDSAEVALQPFLYGDDPADWPAVFTEALKATSLVSVCIGIEPTQMRFLELGYLQSAETSNKFVGADFVFGNLRVSKDDSEIVKMQRAVDIAQAALTATLDNIKTGMTEIQIAAELSIQLLRNGSSADFPFQPIVVSGPNSANPHASPTDRIPQPGDFLLFDYGAKFQGYCSDITRTFGIGHLSDQQVELYNTVLAANVAGRAASRAGVSAGSVDRAARDVTVKARRDQYFTHRTGHGLGMETHEAPYIFAGNSQILEEGMVHTVEPGLYIPELGGVRIEDDVVVREGRSVSLTSFPRELRILEL